MRHGKGRKKVYVKTKDNIDKYIEEHKDLLARKGVTASQLKTRAEENMQTYYHGRKNFEDAVKKEINAVALSKEEYESYEARAEASFEGDKRQFNNKKFGEYAEADLHIYTEDGTPATITGYWTIADSDYVLAKIIIENPYSDSPYEENQYVPRSYVGLK